MRRLNGYIRINKHVILRNIDFPPGLPAILNIIIYRDLEYELCSLAFFAVESNRSVMVFNNIPNYK